MRQFLHRAMVLADLSPRCTCELRQNVSMAHKPITNKRRYIASHRDDRTPEFTGVRSVLNGTLLPGTSAEFLDVRHRGPYINGWHVVQSPNTAHLGALHSRSARACQSVRRQGHGHDRRSLLRKVSDVPKSTASIGLWALR